MPQDIYFATHNMGKVHEIKSLLGEDFNVLSLNDLGIHVEIPETAETLEGNAALKARYLFEKKGVPCFADDSGLEVRALGGAPGVYSARYAGEPKDMKANISLLLKNMEGVEDRYAEFVTVIAYISAEGKLTTYRGSIGGTLTTTPIGDKGFGYDPLFIPIGHQKTFAQLPLAVKNGMSHRAKAVAQFKAAL